ncbi:MAG TPA: PAS domain-containing protein, partial [Methanobacteriaceae archaeon]|nr:PAS domain-containing protein [Methanobacteriaceae archaeon]
MDKNLKIDKLRQKAEKVVQNQIKDLATDSEIVHELRVHQIELEIQNEELREAQIKLEDSRRKYFELYNFAPVGYFTLDEKGIILDVNLAGAGLLGVERRNLNKIALINFIASEHRHIFYQHLKKV